MFQRSYSVIRAALCQMLRKYTIEGGVHQGFGSSLVETHPNYTKLSIRHAVMYIYLIQLPEFA